MHAARPATGRAKRWLPDPVVLSALLLLTACNLAFVWSFPYFISQDGPSHVYNAWVLLNYHEAGFELFRRLLVIDHSPIPNLASHLLLLPLLTLLGPAAAEKALVSLYVVLWPVALVYALRGVRRGNDWLALLGMPLAMNWFLHMGFYNFCLSLVFFLFGIGAWLRRPRGLRGAAQLGGILFALYFCHLVAFLEWCVAVAVIESFILWRSRRRPAALTGKRLRSLALRLLPAVPLLALAAWFVLRAAPEDSDHKSILEFHWARVADLFGGLSGAVAFRHSEDSAAIILKLAYALAAATTLFARPRRHSARAAALGWIVVLFTILFLSVSDNFGGGNFISQRFQIFIYPAALLWMAGRRWSRVPRATLQWLGAGTAILFLAVRLEPYAKLSQQYEERIDLLRKARPGVAVLPVVLTRYAFSPPDEPLAVSVFPLLHASGMAAALGGFLDLSDYEAVSRNFPLRWREGKSPMVIGPIGYPYPKLDLARYPEATGERIDYVEVWDNGGPESKAQARELIVRQLDSLYIPAGRSSPNGFGELFQRRDLPRLSLQDEPRR